MGEVYLARQQSLNRLVALKVLQRRFACCPDGLRRFKVEAEAYARFNHPNIVHFYAIGDAGGRPVRGARVCRWIDIDGVRAEGGPDGASAGRCVCFAVWPRHCRRPAKAASFTGTSSRKTSSLPAKAGG